MTPKTPITTASQTVSQLATLPAVHQAFQWFHLQEPQLRRWHREIASIPAPPFGEATRAAWLCAQFALLGLEDAHVDACGNVLGWLRRATVDASVAPAKDGPDAEIANTEMDPSYRPCILFSAHIDTVFSVEAMRTPVEQGAVLFAPSASDNAAGVTALLALAAAMRAANLRTGVDILFAGNVGEEGEGNLRGMRYLFTESPFRQRITSAVVLDGAGAESIVTEGLGSRRFRVTITGPGGHSWSDAGMPNPILALAAALAEMQKLEVPSFPRTAWNVGRIEGGTVVNAIPEKVEALIDMRSTVPAQLLRLEVALHRAVEDAVLASNRRASQQSKQFKRVALEYTIAMVGERPAARLPESARLLATIRAVDRHLGIRSELRTASTDANVPLSLGIEAISLGSGGSGGGMHTREEWFDATGRDLGLRRILLLLLALAQDPE
jgi:acetylornithine deacetylase/succinyl-diaminopimelate desuccinylase-like protein